MINPGNSTPCLNGSFTLDVDGLMKLWTRISHFNYEVFCSNVSGRRLVKYYNYRWRKIFSLSTATFFVLMVVCFQRVASFSHSDLFFSGRKSTSQEFNVRIKKYEVQKFMKGKCHCARHSNAQFGFLSLDSLQQLCMVSSNDSVIDVQESEERHTSNDSVIDLQESEQRHNERLIKVATKSTRKRKKIQRVKSPSELKSYQIYKNRQKMYEQMMKNNGPDGTTYSKPPSFWTFESLFPNTVVDEEMVQRDLYGVKEQDKKTVSRLMKNYGMETPIIVTKKVNIPMENDNKERGSEIDGNSTLKKEKRRSFSLTEPKKFKNVTDSVSVPDSGLRKKPPAKGGKVNKVLSRLVEDKVNGIRRTATGTYDDNDDDDSKSDGAIQFREGVRLGRPLKLNCDKLTYYGRKALRKNNLSESENMYKRAMEMDPFDGRSYLGLSRVAQRRKDVSGAREYLKRGIECCFTEDGCRDPFLLQALGVLEERAGNLAEAESLYIAAAKEKPSHAAAWVSLAQLRTRKLSQGVNAGRVCYQTAELELQRAGLPASSYVYTAWASLEWKKGGDVKTARTLFQKALGRDPNCSAAWLQLGVMETKKRHWDRAKKCFETVLTFDQRNSRVLQAYAIMESQRPNGDSRTAIDLFERALNANWRDGGVYQAYALYVLKLGDIDSARDLLKRGTHVDRKHAALWQAWGVLETRFGTAEQARDVFQQGIWSCAQSSGGQSGGSHCARLWQAWGVLEAKEGDCMAARQSFSRALDADSRNIAAVTAWTTMEANLNNIKDARLIYNRALKRFPSALSDGKTALWNAYEQMEVRMGNIEEARQIYQMSMRESMSAKEEYFDEAPSDISTSKGSASNDYVLRQSDEGDVWMNNGSIEGKLSESQVKKMSSRNRRLN